MTGNNVITALLETFQEIKKRGEQATLFLETRNGDKFATLSVKLPAGDKPGTLRKTSLGSSKKKSPSTLKRDKERLEKFVLKKTTKETWNPDASSTSNKSQGMVTQALEDEPKNILSDNDQENKVEDTIPKDVLSKEDGEWISNILDKSLDKTPLENMDQREKTDEKANENDDHMEDAKIWAMKQKQSVKAADLSS